MTVPALSRYAARVSGLILLCSISALTVRAEETPYPQRVAALNWTATEMLLSLGVTPVAVTSIKGYRTWQSDHPPLPESVTEAGSRSQVNLPVIARENPDLIVGYPWRHRQISATLEQIAPTLLLPQYGTAGDDSFRYFQAMQDNFLTLARTLGREAKAREQLQQMHEELADCRKQLQRAGLSGRPVLVTKAIGMGLGLRVFGPGSLADSVLTELGLVNLWQRHIPGRDFSHIQIRELSQLGNPHVFLVGGLTDNARQLTDSALWKQLPFVISGQVYPTPQLWSFGGPESARRMARELTTQLLASLNTGADT